MNAEYYFLERIGKPKVTDKHYEAGDGLSTSRELKVSTEANKGEGMVLEENRFDKDKKNDVAIDNNLVRVKEYKVENKSNGWTEYKYITYHDYTNIKEKEYLDYDLRTKKEYIRDEMIQHHTVIKLFFKDSVIDPRFISYLKFAFKTNLIFALNAMAFTDNLIEKRAANPSRVIFN
jgi:hypothetical protein